MTDGRHDDPSFERLAARHRRELHVHCYRMLGSTQDAEDAVQETLLAAWRGLSGFEGRSSVRAWLYRISTNVCLRLIERRPQRLTTPDVGPSFAQTHDLGAPVPGPVWLEPWVEGEPVAEPADHDPAQRLIEREAVELAYVAALQHLPGTQRAVLILREVLGFSAAEVAALLDTTPTSVNSAMQRARQAVDQRIAGRSQQTELAALGEDRVRALVADFVVAWERADVPALVALLAEDAQFTMPPLPAWFDGRDRVAMFLRDRLFATPWRLVPLEAGGQLAFAGYQRQAAGGPFVLGAVTVLAVRDGRIARIHGFVDPAMFAGAGLPRELVEANLEDDR